MISLIMPISMHAVKNMAAAVRSGLCFVNLKNRNVFPICLRHMRCWWRPKKSRYPVSVPVSWRYRPEENTPTLEQRLAELNAPKDPEVEARVDIGFAVSLLSASELRRAKLKKDKDDPELVKQAILRTLQIDLEQVRNEWKKSLGPFHIRRIADHYGIYTDLFKHGYFTPSVPLDVAYDYDEDSVTPVYTGNLIPPSEASSVPQVSFESKPNELWSLVLTNPDGHLLDDEAEYLHWFIGNIKGNDLRTGEVLCDYLQPFPPKGTGYHRFIFILYKQDREIDYSSLKRELPCLTLEERTFRTFDFYKEHQDVLTPAGLAFFQSYWEESLIDFFHDTLNMREPIYEYHQPKQYFKPQVKYPKREPFNLYLDRYRDPKDIRKEVVLKRLGMIHPFEEEPPLPKYPNIYRHPKGRPSWQKAEIWKERNRLGKYRDLRPFTIYPEKEFKNFQE